MSKIIFELVLQDVNAQQAISKFRKEVSDANKEIQKGVGADRFKELTEKIAAAKIETLKLTDEQKKLRKEFAATQVPTDSLAGLRIAYAQVTEQVAKLSRAERESDFGRNLIKRGAGLKSQIDGIEQSLGRFTGNVGNYKSALLGIGDIITGGLATGGIVVGVQKVIEVMSLGINQALKYEKALDDLSALTGVTGTQLEGLKSIEQGLREIELNGVEIVKTGPDILNALKLVGGAQPELLKSADALGEVTEQAIVLSEASGEELEPSVKALTTVLGQFDLAASESKRVINELAAGAKEGAAEIPQITDSLREFGTVAKISNVSTSESIALIEVLAERQLKGSEAGTQLRNVLSKLASADILPKSAQEQFQKLGIDINVLKDATIPFETRLRELGKAQGDLSALTKIFGLENLQAATIITSGIDSYVQLNGAIQGTNEAYKQAEIRADNLSTKIENLQSKALNSLQEEFTGATGAGAGLVSIFDFLIDKVNILGFVADLAVGPIKQIIENINQTIALFSGEEAEQGAFFDISAVEKETKAVDDQTATLLAQIEKLKELDKIKNNAEETDKKRSKSNAKTKTEVDLVAGSIAYFRDQIAGLQKELDNTPPESPLFKKLAKQIVDAEEGLARVQELLKSALDPKDIETDVLPAAGGITVPVSLEVQNEDETAKKLEDFARRTSKKGAEIKSEEDEIAAEKKRKEDEDFEKAVKEAAFDTAKAISDGIFEIQRSRQEKQKNDALAALDEETAKRIEQAQGNAILIEKIEKEADEKRAEIEKKSALRAKNLALKQAAIDTALSIIKALASAAPPLNFILAAAAAVAGAVQLAVIKKQEFARGGIAKQGTFGGRPHSSGGTKGVFEDGTQIEVEKDEDFIILNKRASAERRRLSNLNQRFGGVSFANGGIANVTSKLIPQFANGGFASDFAPQIALPSASGGQTVVVQSVAMFTDEQINVLAARVAQQTGAAAKSGVGEGLEDNNRLKERQEALTRNREA